VLLAALLLIAAALVGIVVAGLRRAPLWAGAWAAARPVAMIAAGAALLRALERRIARR